MIKTLDTTVCLTHNNICIEITIEDNYISMSVYEKDTNTLYPNTLDKKQEYYQNLLTKFGISEKNAKTISMHAIFKSTKAEDIKLIRIRNVYNSCYDKLISAITNKDKSLIKKEELEILADKLQMTCTYDDYKKMSNEEKKYYDRACKNWSKDTLRYHKLIAKLLNDYKEFADKDIPFYMECDKLKLEQKPNKPLHVTECVDTKHYKDLQCNCLSFKDLDGDDEFKEMFKSIKMSKYLKHTMPIDKLNKIVQDNIKLTYKYRKDENKQNKIIRDIASSILNNIDKDDVFNNINSNSLQTLNVDDWFTSENETDANQDIYTLVYTQGNLSDNILEKLHNKDNEKTVAHTDIIDLIVRFLKHTTMDDII
jgi:hypothetical protein